MKSLKNVLVALAFVFAFGAALVTNANSSSTMATTLYDNQFGNCIQTSCLDIGPNVCTPSAGAVLHVGTPCTQSNKFSGTPKRF